MTRFDEFCGHIKRNMVSKNKNLVTLGADESTQVFDHITEPGDFQGEVLDEKEPVNNNVKTETKTTIEEVAE